MADRITADPGTLTLRAQRFLSRCARWQPIDRGLTGSRLRERIQAVYGQPNERIVSLLEVVQSRYGGLTYFSGFFESDIVFSPTCEPDDPASELEILYAIDAEGPSGATLYADGTVAIGIDQFEVREFSHLDSVIECDAMFNFVEHLGTAEMSTFYCPIEIRDAVEQIRSDRFLGLRKVEEASGNRTHWFVADSIQLYITGAWSELGVGVMAPLVKVWSGETQVLSHVRDLLSADLPGPS